MKLKILSHKNKTKMFITAQDIPTSQYKATSLWGYYFLLQTSTNENTKWSAEPESCQQLRNPWYHSTSCTSGTWSGCLLLRVIRRQLWKGPSIAMDFNSSPQVSMFWCVLPPQPSYFLSNKNSISNTICLTVLRVKLWNYGSTCHFFLSTHSNRYH